MLTGLLERRRRFLGATEGILVLIGAMLMFTAIMTISTVPECGLCSADRLPPWVDLLGGASFIASGLLLRVRRPHNALWLLMMAAGFGRLFEITLVQFPITLFVPWHWVRNLLLVAVPWHIALAFPTGRPLRRFRFVVPSVYIWAATAATIRSLAVDREALALHDNPNVLVEGIANPELWQHLLNILPVWGDVNIALALTALIVRWVTGNQAIRRAFATVFLVLPLLLAEALSDLLPFIPLSISTWVVQLASFGIPITVVLGIVGPRLWEGRIANLLEDLEVAATPADVERAVQDAMEDPTIRLGTKRASSEEFADVHGQPLDTSATEGETSTTITHEDATLGILLHSANIDLPLMKSIAQTAAVTLQRHQLQAEVQAQLEEVRRSRERIVAATDQARHSIERDLHDGAQQSLVALAMSLDLEKNQFDDPKVHTLIDDAARQVRSALEEIRRLSRGMYPPALVSDGLAVAIEGLADSMPIPVEVDVIPDRFEARVEAAAYFMVAEALTNTAKYANARTSDVSIVRDGNHLVVQVMDDGDGGAHIDPGSGLEGIADRVAAIGGDLRLHSPAGSGTTLLARLPIT